MKERVLYGVLLLCICASAIVMAFILNSLSSVRMQAFDAGPAGFHNVIQLQNGIGTFAANLEEYRNNLDNPERLSEVSAESITLYNVLWSALKNVYISFPDNSEYHDQVSIFKHEAEEFLTLSEPMLELEATLTTEQLSRLIDELHHLNELAHRLGASYFNYTVDFRDNLDRNLNRLYKMLWVFTAALLIATALLVSSIVRSNLRKNALVKVAQDARRELNTTVAELRSGRVEQRAKNSFIAAASHDLKQPLHALGLFLGSLESHVTSAEGKKTLEDANNCANNLGALFNSMLDISRLDAGVVQVNYEHIRLQPVIEMLTQEFRAKADKKFMRIILDVDDVVVYCDSILVCRIIRNLIENALIHSRATEITIRCLDKDHVLVVEDNGRGIPVQDQVRVFREYDQLENRPGTESKGLGLGLSIVKRIADLLDVPLNLESIPGKVTRFSLALKPGDRKAVVTNIPEQHQLQHIGVEANGMTVCVIDDDENICKAMTVMLTQMGLNAVAGIDADKVIDSCIESNILPDLIVADFRLLKGRTGDQAILQVKRALNVDVPGMLITGDTSPAHVAEAAESGFVLLHKPVQPQILAASIAETLSKSHGKVTSQAV